jgi:type II secretion system protein G
MQSFKRGFTLIEILVVISILSILLSIVIFSGSDARDAAKITTEEATVEQLNLALSLYRNTTNSFPPGVDNCSLCDLRAGNIAVGQTQWDLVVAALAPKYIGDSISTDMWGNPYAYDNNYQVTGDLYYTTLCSMGPDGQLQTFVAGDASFYEITRAEPPTRGDDICFFAL